MCRFRAAYRPFPAWRGRGGRFPLSRDRRHSPEYSPADKPLKVELEVVPASDAEASLRRAYDLLLRAAARAQENASGREDKSGPEEVCS